MIRVRAPLFRGRPSLRPLVSPRARVLVLMSPLDAGVKPIYALAKALRRRAIELSAASECHGEVRSEKRELLEPNLLLVEAATREWDALVVAGGRGAQRMVEDQFARDLIARSQGKPIAALGEGRDVLARAGVAGFLSEDPQSVARWLSDKLGIDEVNARSPSLSLHHVVPRPS